MNYSRKENVKEAIDGDCSDDSICKLQESLACLITILFERGVISTHDVASEIAHNIYYPLYGELENNNDD